ncbi:MAG TPA: hypothetical protein VFE34_18475 [Dongiaceae bacterium]|jgi:hypothetical protein|nr:hypothetical protein [Dongiaceae bacterium]
MFYSRPNLSQLGLDLIEVYGSIGEPSEYWGETADGRAIHLHYDYGRLSISASADRQRPAEDLLNASIGPALNGEILLEQICDLAGITIRGERPTLSEDERRNAAEKAWILDWSGRTTYWVREVLVTEEGGRRLERELAAVFPGLKILEVDWDWDAPKPRRRFLPRKTISQCRRSALFGFKVDESRFARMMTRDHVTLAELDEVFAHHLSFRFRWNDRRAGHSLAAEQLINAQRAIVTPESELLGDFETKFATDDEHGHAYVRRLNEAVEHCFSNWVEGIDLGTGETIRGPRALNWYSHDLRDWCAAAPHRYLFSLTERAGKRRNLGVRACFAPV